MGSWRPCKGAYVMKCPNHCSEKIVDQLVERNTVQGNPPRICTVHFGIAYEAVPWSARLRRYPEKSTKAYATETMRYCPICGEKLEDPARP